MSSHVRQNDPTPPPPPAAALLAGAATVDVTPPIGIYNRMWGAATHDRAEGIHRPIEATVLALRTSADAAPLLLVSLDYCVLSDADFLAAARAPLEALVGGDPARVIIACTHTHGVGMMSRDRLHLPGGDLIPAYLDRLRDGLGTAAFTALAKTVRATLTWATGRCCLATNRDLPDPDPTRNRDVVGYNPDLPADDALLVGRLTADDGGAPLATIVNYACHPTTLAWENRDLSPDYIGAMREIVKSATGGAPVLFLQGASGELAPAYQYVGDGAVPDAHGRQLGYAVLSTLAGMLPPGLRLQYEGVMESGAPLAVWRPAPFTPDTTVAARILPITIPLKPQPTIPELEARMAAATDRFTSERLRRKIALVQQFGNGPTTTTHVWLWRLGGTLLVAQPNEAYSVFQQTLRAALPDAAVAVVGLANGWAGYLPPREIFDRDSYPVWQTPYDIGALEVITDACLAAGASLMEI